MNRIYTLSLALAGIVGTTITFADSTTRTNAPPGHSPQVKCTGENDHEWVQSKRDALADEVLYRFAIAQAGPATSCQAKITATTEEGKFGTITFHFGNAMTYTAESMPPETSAITLSALNGFPDEAKAIRQIKTATTQDGLHVDWSKPNIEKSSDTEIKTFWDPAEGTNGRGFLSYRKGKLISVGFGMAL